MTLVDAYGRATPERRATADVLSRRSTRFVHLALCACLLLQRFGLSTASGSTLFTSLPAYALLLAWMLHHKQARISRRGLILFALVVSTFSISTVVAIVAPDPRVANSGASLAAILVTYSLFTVRPTDRFDTSHTLRIFLTYARALSVVGVVQYCAQYAGVSFFWFSDALPFLEPVLIEKQFAYRPVIAYGSEYMRSNALFLVEPSTFSQVLVLAMLVEYFVNRDYRFLLLYGVAYLVTHSGTGLLCLLASLAIYSMTSPKNMMRTLGIVAAGAAIAVVAALVVPSIAETFARRATELDRTGSSGYARYLAQFDSIRVFIQEARSLIGYGPGATERSIYWVKGSGNPGLKLFIDYGIVGLLAFAAFLVATLRRARHLILPIACLVIFQLGGGTLLFTPFVVLIAVLCVWSRPSSVRFEIRRSPERSASYRWREPPPSVAGWSQNAR